MSVMKTTKRLVPLALLWLLVLPRAGWSQSFDCSQAQSDTEWAICSTPELGALDNRLAAMYHKLSDSASTSPALRKQASRMQDAWLHGRRDMCGGNVDCLMNAYQDMLDALSSLPFNDAAIVAARTASVVPRCGDPSDPMKASAIEAGFATVVCRDPQLLGAVRQIESRARELQPRLTPVSRIAFDAQEAAFPQTAYGCPQDREKLVSCVATAIAQRLQDVADLAANLDRRLPDCKPSELSLSKGEVGDGGMSKTLNTYLLQYAGTEACRIRGFPTIQVENAKGGSRPRAVVYAGQTWSSSLPGAPLPVTLSAKNNSVWFGILTASACDPPYGINVKVALPLSSVWLATLRFPDASCPVTVTPIGMISTLRSSVH
jgi:uncharacterized protein YecT (DUF1311 family)